MCRWCSYCHIVEISSSSVVGGGTGGKYGGLTCTSLVEIGCFVVVVGVIVGMVVFIVVSFVFIVACGADA